MRDARDACGTAVLGHGESLTMTRPAESQRRSGRLIVKLRRLAMRRSLPGGAANATVAPGARTGAKTVPLALLALILFIDVGSAWRMTRTYDERRHLSYGRSVLRGSWARMNKYDNSKMPVSALNALPAALGERMTSPAWLEDLSTSLRAARIATTLASLLLAWFVYRWASELYGSRGGLLSLVLYAFSPNLIAHASLVTTDLFAACSALVATYCFWKFLRFRGWKEGLASAATLGASQLVKYTSLFLYPIFAAILAVRAITPAADPEELERSPPRPWRTIRWALAFASISVLVINVGFGFEGSFTPLGRYPFKSALFRWIQTIVPGAAQVPVPLPFPYLQGLDWIVHDERTGATSGSVYLFGELRSAGRGFTGYFLYAFLFKEPLAFQALTAWAAARRIAARYRFRFRDAELFLLCPVLFYTIYFNFFFREQIGIRFFLVALPFLHVFCGSLCADERPLSPAQRTWLGVLLAYLVASVLSYFPYYLSYFNELVWDRKAAYRILADSNVDWGQCGWYLDRYKEDHPAAIVEPDGPTAGRVVVGVNLLTGIFPVLDGRPAGAEKYRWLRDNFAPVDHVAHCYLVFEVTPEALANLLRRERP